MTNKEIIEKIIDGCREVKKDSGIHEDAKKLATLVIKDCNDALKKEWVGLTKEELEHFENAIQDGDFEHPAEIVYSIVSILKEKNSTSEKNTQTSDSQEERNT
jgi:hypothetical protein